MKYLIDMPTPFSPRQEWEAFLEEMKRLPNDPEIIAARETAQRMLERLDRIDAGKGR